MWVDIYKANSNKGFINLKLINNFIVEEFNLKNNKEFIKITIKK